MSKNKKNVAIMAFSLSKNKSRRSDGRPSSWQLASGNWCSLYSREDVVDVGADAVVVVVVVAVITDVAVVVVIVLAIYLECSPCRLCIW